jgi:hypothetical protein
MLRKLAACGLLATAMSSVMCASAQSKGLAAHTAKAQAPPTAKAQAPSSGPIAAHGRLIHEKSGGHLNKSSSPLHQNLGSHRRPSSTTASSTAVRHIAQTAAVSRHATVPIASRGHALADLRAPPVRVLPRNQVSPYNQAGKTTSVAPTLWSKVQLGFQPAYSNPVPVVPQPPQPTPAAVIATLQSTVGYLDQAVVGSVGQLLPQVFPPPAQGSKPVALSTSLNAVRSVDAARSVLTPSTVGTYSGHAQQDSQPVFESSASHALSYADGGGAWLAANASGAKASQPVWGLCWAFALVLYLVSRVLAPTNVPLAHAFISRLKRPG